MPVLITARRDGFRRLGIAHSAKTTAYPDDHFSALQLAILETEPQLIVQRIDGDDQAGQPDEDLQQLISQQIERISSLSADNDKQSAFIAQLQSELEQKDAALLQLDEDGKALQARVAELESQQKSAADGQSDTPDDAGADKKTAKK